MNGPLSTATIVVALLLGIWYLIRSALNRAPSNTDLWAVVGLISGDRPGETTTFIGYLITTVAFAPVGFYLARLEPTRWGTLILGVACLVLPVLVLRLQQIAEATGG
jgi:threonine/homoserine efflux transporter RhtA